MKSRLYSRASAYTIIGFIVFCVILAAIKFGPFMLGFGAWGGMPPTTVTSLQVAQQTWSDSLNLVGSLQAHQGAVFKAEVAGRVAEINFTAGQNVEAGQVLIRLDSAVEEAQLKEAEAAVRLAKLTYDRMSQMLNKESVSRQSYDQSKAELEKSQAQVEALKATIARKAVTAPFAGIAGIRQISIGQFMDVGVELVSLYSLSPLYLNFSFPESSLSQVRVGQTVQFETDTLPGEQFSAAISAINPQVDPITRNIWAQASLPNTDGKLRPGMFARLRVQLSSEQSVIPIPASSVMYAPYGDSVFVIEAAAADGKQQDQAAPGQRVVRQQFIKLGPARGDQVAVLSGLKPGEEIVSAGAFKLMPGAAVLINNSVLPSNDPNPKPAER